MQFDAVVEIDGRLHVSTPGGEKKALCSLLGSTLCFFFIGSARTQNEQEPGG
jgi:hypothetical protein